MHAKRMTIIVSADDSWHHRPLYLAILERLRAVGCSGATASRGVAGFGAGSHIRSGSIGSRSGCR